MYFEFAKTWTNVPFLKGEVRVIIMSLLWAVTLSNNDKIFITEESAIKSAGTEL